jgi:hypothetical protein
MLDILKVKNWLLVFLTRFTLEFKENILELKEKFKNKDFRKKLELDLKNKLDKYIEMKKNKLLALQLLIENLDKKWENEYKNLAKYYFNHSLKDFYIKFLKSEKNEYEEYLLR